MHPVSASASAEDVVIRDVLISDAAVTHFNVLYMVRMFRLINQWEDSNLSYHLINLEKKRRLEEVGIQSKCASRAPLYM